MFYDRYVSLCAKKGVSPSRAALEAGISKSLVSKWKANESKEPSPEVIRKLADYFGIPAYEVLEDIQQKENPSASDGTGVSDEEKELAEYLEMLRTRPECRMLFKLADNATKEDVEKAVAIIEALRKVEDS